MKKVLSVLLVMVMCCGLVVGCGKKESLIEKSIKLINEEQSLDLEFIKSKENNGVKKGTTNVTHLYEDGDNSVNVVTNKESNAISMVSVSIGDKGTSAESALLVAETMGIIDKSGVDVVENELKNNGSTEFQKFKIGYMSGFCTIMPTKDAELLNWDDTTGLSVDDFLNNFTELVSGLQYKFSNENSFEQDGKTFKSYTLSSAVDSSYLAYSTKPGEKMLVDIMIISNPGAFTYFYATQALLSIDKSIDYASVFEEVGVTEDGAGDIGVKTTRYNNMTIAFERKADRQQFAIMFH